MRFTSVILAFAATALAQDNTTTITTTSTIQGLDGTANFLGQLAQQLKGQTIDLSMITQYLPQINGILSKFVPQGATWGDVTKILLSGSIAAEALPAAAYAAIPPGVLTGPEYYVALKAAPQVVSLLQSDIAPLASAIPSDLPLTNLASFIASNTAAIGSAVSNIIQTALPQASSLLIQLESSAASFTEPSSLCSASATAAATAGSSQATTSIAIATGSATRTGSTTTPTIVTGAADKVFVGKAMAVGAVMVAALL